MYQETPTGTNLMYLSLARLSIWDNLYRPEFREFQDRSIPDPPPPQLSPANPPDTKHLLDLEERAAEPPSVTVPDLDL